MKRNDTRRILSSYNPFLDGAKYHKKEVVYLPCNDENWLVDELRERSRPTERRNLQLSEVLRRSE